MSIHTFPIVNELDPDPATVPPMNLDKSEEEILYEEADENARREGRREEHGEDDEDLEPVEPPRIVREHFPSPPNFQPFDHDAPEHQRITHLPDEFFGALWI